MLQYALKKRKDGFKVQHYRAAKISAKKCGELWRAAVLLWWRHYGASATNCHSPQCYLCKHTKNWSLSGHLTNSRLKINEVK